MNASTVVLGVLLCTSFGFVFGVFWATGGLLRQAGQLDAERRQLEYERSNLRQSQRDHFVQVVHRIQQETPLERAPEGSRKAGWLQ